MAGKEATVDKYIWYMKTAVAFACIRCKPNGLSAREYTEKLCAQYRAAECQWKQKYEQAEQTILRLKQSQELQSLVNFSGLSDVIPFLSFDNCSLSHDQNEEPMEVEGNSEHIRHNTGFIKSYLLLKQLNREISEKVTSSASLQSTLENSLTLICRSIYQDEVLSSQIITDCFQVLRNMSSLMKQYFPHEQLKKLVEIIIDRVLNSDKLERKQRRELIFTLRDLLIPQMTGHILHSLLAAIESFSLHLRTVSQTDTPLDTKMYENMYFVFDMFEVVLKECKGQGSVMKGEGGTKEITGSGHQLQTADLLSEVNDRLDQCVLYISDKFPLFVCKIWLIQYNHL